MAQLYKIRLPDGRVLIPGDWTSAEPLYSTVEIGVGSFPVLAAFCYGVGSGEVPGSIGPRNATLQDTNLQGEGGRLPENEELIIYNLAIECFHVGAQSLVNPVLGGVIDPPFVSYANMLRLTRDIIVITNIAYVKQYTHESLAWFPASTGVNLTSDAPTFVTDGASGFLAGNNGQEAVCGARQFASPLYVAGGEALSVEFYPGPGSVTDLDAESTAGANDGRIRLRTFFEGYRKRPVA